MVGNGDGIHALRFGELHQLGNPAGAVEKAVMGVAMKVNEGLVGHDDPDSLDVDLSSFCDCTKMGGHDRAGNGI
jgi:hypothetical protein